MKITTLNMHGFFDWDERYQAIEDYFEKYAPDVAFFQEVVYLPQVSPYTQVELINKRLEYPHYNASITRLQTSPQYKEYREGLAVLSKLPILNTETIVLKQKEGDPLQRLVQFLDVAEGETVWKFANVHFAEGMGYAYVHLREVMDIMHQRGEKRIVIGDFNFSDLAKHNELWRDDYIVSTQVEDYLSFPDGPYTIDYLLVPKEYTLNQIDLSDGELSDHRAITAEIA